MSNTPFKWRTKLDRDKPYAFRSLYHNLRDEDPHYKETPQPVYSHHMDRIMQHHWDNSQWVMLAGGEVEDYLVGFLCGQFTEAAAHVHYVYVRKRYRGHGLGRKLVQEFLTAGFGGRHTHREPPLVLHSTRTRAAREWEAQHTRWERVGAGDGDVAPHRVKGTYWLGCRWLYNPFALTYGMPEGWWL